jgi:hypothetical protein
MARVGSAGAAMQVVGFREFLIACDNAGRDTKVFAREALREAGEEVRQAAGAKFAKYDEKTSGGYRTRVRRTGVSVEQSLRRTTGLRPDFGALQMRKALIPALNENEERTVLKMEEAVTLVAEKFATVPPVAGLVRV